MKYCILPYSDLFDDLSLVYLCLAALEILHFLVSKAVDGMIVDHAGRLHIGVANGRPDEGEAGLFQRLASHRIRGSVHIEKGCPRDSLHPYSDSDNQEEDGF